MRPHLKDSLIDEIVLRSESAGCRTREDRVCKTKAEVRAGGDGRCFKSFYDSRLPARVFQSLISNFSLSLCLEVAPITFVASSALRALFVPLVCRAASHFIPVSQSSPLPLSAVSHFIHGGRLHFVRSVTILKMI